MLQTHRDFDDYEDVIGRYHDRPSLWVEPKGQWGAGEIQLLELPTTGETMDNVVAFWKPQQAIQGVAAAIARVRTKSRKRQYH